ncbi:MAG: tRNA (adenosine(37)-N6)-dimethylallyltransferase MiaA [Spirochaetales bacterium]|nr:MAG: tRNA (adenosine(37)-N6)-dimethylallyltransferase MiaA [Spirochaetales bacterium]
MNTESKAETGKAPIPVVNLFGPTAVGKTSLLINLFKARAEIVSADSMQVYRFMDIGTAKPDAETRRVLPHHLIDIRNPDEQYSSGDFVQEAVSCIRDIASRGLLPVVSGGTAFYFKNLVCGLPETPPADSGIRDGLKKEIAVRGRETLYRELENFDPGAASRINAADTYRIIRALEVIRLTGRPLSSFARNVPSGGPYRFLSLGVWRERADLAARIEARVEGMFRKGLEEEVRGLLTKGYGPEDPGLRGIGYAEFLNLRNRGCLTFAEVKQAVIHHSRQYAKRQTAFFRSLPEVVWIHAEEEDRILRTVDGFLQGADCTS